MNSERLVISVRQAFKLFILLVSCSLLIGCEDTKHNHSSSDNYSETIKDTAIEYSTHDYQEHQVPMKSAVKISGQIVKTDAKDKEQIKKSDRFILETDDFQFHIINASDTPLSLGDLITVYGEYNGITVASMVDFND